MEGVKLFTKSVYIKYNPRTTTILTFYYVNAMGNVVHFIHELLLINRRLDVKIYAVLLRIYQLLGLDEYSLIYS